MSRDASSSRGRPCPLLATSDAAVPAAWSVNGQTNPMAATARDDDVRRGRGGHQVLAPPIGGGKGHGGGSTRGTRSSLVEDQTAVRHWRPSPRTLVPG